MRVDANGFERALGVDALLYGGSAGFALHVASSSPMLRNTTWASFAWPTYAAGAVAALALMAVVSWLDTRRLAQARLLLALAVVAGAVVAPLAVEVQWRTEPGRAPPGSLHPYGASEVVVTEGAAEALVHGRDPYSTHFASRELEGRSPGTVEHFPYLPAMAVFGLPRALVGSTPWTDARIFFALGAALVAAFALARWRAPPEQRLRALQLLVVLPTGAHAIVTGGDDVPVLALSLLSLVLLERGRHEASAGALAVAALLKLTAWPLLIAFAATSRRGVRLAGGLVALGVVPAVAAGPADFADDVLLFPTGLTALPSPAASATLGSTLVGGAPLNATRVALTLALFALAALLSAAVLRALAARAAGPAGAAAAAGVILLGLIMLSPVARAGYLVYPIDLLTWAFLLRTPPPATAALPLTHAPEALAA